MTPSTCEGATLLATLLMATHWPTFAPPWLWSKSSTVFFPTLNDCQVSRACCEVCVIETVVWPVDCPGAAA